MSFRSWLARRYDFFIKKWFLSFFLVTLAGHWFLFLRLFGRQFGLIDATGKLSNLAQWITWPVFAASLIFALLKVLGDRWNDDAQVKAQRVLGSLLQSANAVTGNKVKRFVDYICSKRRGDEIRAFADITQPRDQIERLLENIQFAISHIFDIDREKIGLSILYQTDANQNWEWVHTINTDDDLTLAEITDNPESTALQVVNSNTDTVFYPDKRDGIAARQYAPGRKDARHENVGSVLCRDISIGESGCRMRAILSITTYGTQLCSARDQGAMQKINNVIIDTFAIRIRLELSLLYIKEVLTPRCLECV